MKRNRALGLLLILFAITFLPLAAATLLYLFAPDWRPWGTSNNGTLIMPPRPLSAEGLTALEGEPVDASLLTGKWTFVYIGSPDCDTECRGQLYEMRQARLALGRNADRVQRLYVYPHAEGTPTDLARLVKENPGLHFTRSAPGWVDMFEVDERDPAEAGRLYVVDPLGNLMMRYEPELDASMLLEDMKRLLKASRVG